MFRRRTVGIALLSLIGMGPAVRLVLRSATRTAAVQPAGSAQGTSQAERALVAETEPLAVVKARLVNQARDHWSAFAAIVASVNIGAALALFGTCVTASLSTEVLAAGLLIGATSTVASILAYYSITLGGALNLGVVRISQVLASFLIAAAQIGCFLWPLYVLRQTSPQNTLWFVDQLRWWLLIEATFCVTAAFANLVASRTRNQFRGAIPDLIDQYYRQQRSDRRFASLAGLLSLASWLLSHVTSPFWCLIAGATVAVAMLLGGLRSQAKTADGLDRLTTDA